MYDSPILKWSTIFFIHILKELKFLEPTEPEPSTMNTISADASGQVAPSVVCSFLQIEFISGLSLCRSRSKLAAVSTKVSSGFDAMS